MGSGDQLLGNAGQIGTPSLGGFANPLTDLSAGIGLVQTIAGLNGLNKVPAYTPPPIDPRVIQYVNKAQEMSKNGYTQEQVTDYYNQMAMRDHLLEQKGTETAGGNLALAVNNGINSSNILGLNKFASDNAALQQKHQLYADSATRYLQSLETGQWNKNDAHIQALNNAWSGAARSGLSTLTGALEAGASGYGKGNNTTSTQPSLTGNPTTTILDPNSLGNGDFNMSNDPIQGIGSGSNGLSNYIDAGNGGGSSQDNMPNLTPWK